MENNDSHDDDWSSTYTSMGGIAELSENMVNLIAKSGAVHKTIKTLQDRLAKDVFSFISELYNPEWLYNLKASFKIFADGILLSKLQTLGAYEWCNIDEWIELDKTEIEKNSGLKFSDLVILRLNREPDFSFDKVNRYVGSRFTRDILSNIEEDTSMYLYEKDAEKLKRAMVNFRARRYMDSANLLASLIDSQSIKQEIFDVQSGKYQEKFIRKDGPNISQGWKSFYHVFSNNFARYFDYTEFSGEGKQDKREESFNRFITDIKGKIPSDDTIVSVVVLSICLLQFFSDTKWTDYPYDKPAVLNRHWLMHGMYDLDDITRYDCIKLLLILNQISRLYEKLRKGEL